MSSPKQLKDAQGSLLQKIRTASPEKTDLLLKELLKTMPAQADRDALLANVGMQAYINAPAVKHSICAGFALLVVALILSFIFSTPTPTQLFALRAVFAVSITLITLIVPGQMDMKGKIGSMNVESVGRITLLLIILFADAEWTKEYMTKVGRRISQTIPDNHSSK